MITQHILAGQSERFSIETRATIILEASSPAAMLTRQSVSTCMQALVIARLSRHQEISGTNLSFSRSVQAWVLMRRNTKHVPDSSV